MEWEQHDIVFLHAPAYFDFRKEDRIYFPFLSTSGDVPITPVYEYFPLGFKSLKKYIEANDHKVRIMNLCSYMLQNPEEDVEEYLKNIHSSIIGIDLHWLVHVQGALAVAKELKRIHKDTYILLGGISSSYYAGELIKYPFVDFVMRGYDTHMPMERLVTTVKENGSLKEIPNLLWKDIDGRAVENPMSHLPAAVLHSGEWGDLSAQKKNLLSINDIVSTTNVGCAFNCNWCGGSNDAFKRLYADTNSPIYKSAQATSQEFLSMNKIEDINKFNFYSCGNYNLPEKDFLNYLDQVENYPFKSIDYEQYYLPGEKVLKRMAEVNKNSVITLSPESHDTRIGKLAGRGNYSMDKMERWIEKALNIGVAEIDIWFFIGMPGQDEKSVMETVSYCDRLLKRFEGCKVVPMICPMIPFLDPASNFFEHPEKYGYHIFYRTIEEHHQAMGRASLINRLNYETKWLSREQIVKTGYKAITELFEMKGDHGMLPRSLVDRLTTKLQDTVDFIEVIDQIDNIKDPLMREANLKEMSDEIRKRNREVFFDGVLSQAFPIARNHGQRWIDCI